MTGTKLENLWAWLPRVTFAMVLSAMVFLVAFCNPAYGATAPNFEAEGMRMSSKDGGPFRDSKASAGKGLVIKRNASASIATKTPALTRMAVRARGDMCEGAPRMVVAIDGKRVMSVMVRSSTWKNYNAYLNVPSGSHKVSISFTNDHRRALKCDRNLRVDKVSFTKRAAPVTMGVFVDGPSAQRARDFDALTGGNTQMLIWMQDWSRPFDPSTYSAVSSEATPVMSWHPLNFGEGGRIQSKYALRTIIRGDHDRYIRDYARGAAKWGRPMYIRLMHEMNGNWYGWGVGVNGNRPGEYVKAWRHIHDIFEQERATNVKWVWSPHVVTEDWPLNQPLSDLYPGHRYVDWVAMDGYNWGNTRPDWNTKWSSFEEIFGGTYAEMNRLAPSKPIMIAETASTEQGGNKALWIRETFQKTLPQKFPKVRAVLWFHSRWDNDWPVDTSQSSLGAYREVLANPYYKGRTP
jgi:beta-mannanase